MRVENKKMARVWEDSCLCPETSTKNGGKEFRLSLHVEQDTRTYLGNIVPHFIELN